MFGTRGLTVTHTALCCVVYWLTYQEIASFTSVFPIEAHVTTPVARQVETGLCCWSEKPLIKPVNGSSIARLLEFWIIFAGTRQYDN